MKGPRGGGGGRQLLQWLKPSSELCRVLYAARMGCYDTSLGLLNAAFEVAYVARWLCCSPGLLPGQQSHYARHSLPPKYSLQQVCTTCYGWRIGPLDHSACIVRAGLSCQAMLLCC
jgi:hypothetical protein